MKKLTKWWPLLLLGVAVVAIIMLAAGLSTATLRPSQPFPVWIFQELDPDELPAEQATSKETERTSNLWGRLVLYFALGIIILWIITFIFHPKAQRRMLVRLLSYTIILLIIYMFYGNFQKMQFIPQGGGDDVGIGPGASFLQEPPPLPAIVSEPPQWLVTIITLVIMALVVGAAWWLGQRYLRYRRQVDPAVLLAQEARQAVKTLEAGSDLKDTVTRCYRDMSRVLHQQRGITRQKAMTPREFEMHLANIGFHDDHIQRLTRLFESVRYGANTVSERDKREAMDCLNAIVSVYGGAT
ncbi:DUF4129 domain-containing protein [Chloroflexota bacterium]